MSTDTATQAPTEPPTQAPTRRLTRREQTAIVQSLGAGVVPRIGLPHIQVGRLDEVEAIVEDLKKVEEGSSTVRFVVGRFGSGKTFFLNLMRTVALERKFVVVQADITTDRRLHGTGGKARGLYSELMNNLATRSKPEGGALSNLVEKWIGDKDYEIRQNGGSDDDVVDTLTEELKPLQDLVSGFDFATVLTKYYEGYLGNDDSLQECARRWLRAEYRTRTEARNDLGVRTIIDDADIYGYLKLFAAFVRIAGYAGLMVNVDELVVLSHRLNSTVSRNNNYEAILRILNDCLQGQTEGLCFMFAGTDECLEDRRRGLYSYEALATRLAPNRFATDEMRDLSSPVIRLASLTPEDCYVLLNNIRNVFASYDEQAFLLPDEGIIQYLKNCSSRMGAAYFQTPRDTVRDYVGLLQILQQNPEASWEQLLQSGASTTPPKPEGSHDESDESAPIPTSTDADDDEDSDDEDLADFKL